MAISKFLMAAHEEAFWSAAQISLRSTLPGSFSVGDLGLRRAISRIDRAARAGDGFKLFGEMDKVVERAAAHSRYTNLHARASLLLESADPGLPARDVAGLRESLRCLETLGADRSSLARLSAAIDADDRLDGHSHERLANLMPQLHAQWDGEPDPSTRARIAQRTDTVMDLLYVAVPNPSTKTTVRCTSMNWRSPSKNPKLSSRKSSVTQRPLAHVHPGGRERRRGTN